MYVLLYKAKSGRLWKAYAELFKTLVESRNEANILEAEGFLTLVRWVDTVP